MSGKYRSKLILNVSEGKDHKSKITSLFKDVQSFQCMVAFAKNSAWKEIKPFLVKALAQGTTVRFGIGLDFFHTDPALLADLYKIASKPGSLLELYISDTSETFHPKIYTFTYPEGSKVLIGSANFTQGGLSDNYEASILIDDADAEMTASVRAHFDQLIEDEMLVPATEARIDRYRYEHEIYTEAFRLAKRRARHTIATSGYSLYALSEFLRMMKDGGSNSRFESDMAIRSETRKIAGKRLREIAESKADPVEGFESRLGDLISAFHSSGIVRSKSSISEFPAEFTDAVKAIVKNAAVEPREAFATLYGYFQEIRGAGINLLTEILHSLDNERFAVMNQNSVSGLRIAGYHSFPERPTKSNVDAELYQLYCENAAKVRTELGLVDYTQLDALFNFVYWHEGADGQAEASDD